MKNPTMVRLWMLCCTAALFFCTAFITPEVSVAQIACCDVTYTNNTKCDISFCLRTASGPVCVNVPSGERVVITLPPSLCNDPSIYVVDRCNNPIKIPFGCTTVALAPSCCAQICMTAGIAGCWFVSANPTGFACFCLNDEALSYLGQ